MNTVINILVNIGFWMKNASILNIIWQTFLEVDHSFPFFFLSLEYLFIHQNTLVVTNLKLCSLKSHKVDWEMDCEITQQHIVE